MLQSMRSRRMVASVGVILGLSVTVTAVAAAQSPCAERVVGTFPSGPTHPGGHTHPGELVGWRSVRDTKEWELNGEVGAEVGRGAGAPSGSGALGGRRSETKESTYNVGTYEFPNGQRYEVNCATLAVVGEVRGPTKPDRPSMPPGPGEE